MPPEIPGFYFDNERGRYFKIASVAERPNEAYYHKQEIKRRKYKKEEETSVKEINAKRLELYEKNIFQLADPFEMAFKKGHAEGLMKGMVIQDRAVRSGNSYNTKIDSSFGLLLNHHNIASPLICDEFSQEKISLVYATSQKVLNYQNIRGRANAHDISLPIENELLTVIGHNYMPEEPDVNRHYRTIRLEGKKTSSEGLYFHARLNETNKHVFALIFEDPAKCKTIFVNFKKRENVHDSINLGSHFLVAAGASLQSFKWHTDGSLSPILDRKLDTKRKSDILTLAAYRRNSNPIRLYAGYRDGSIVSFPLDAEFRPQFEGLGEFKPPKVRTILNIKCTKLPGMVFASAILEKTPCIFMLNLSILPKNPVISVLKTTFINLTREHEFFEVTPDAHFVLYGSSKSREGKGDFQVFSTFLEDNLFFEKHSNCTYLFPIRSTEEENFINISLSSKRIRCITFGNVNSENVGHESVIASGNPRDSLIESVKLSDSKLIFILEDPELRDAYLASMALVTTDIL